MEKVYLMIMLLAGTLIGYIITKNDRDKDNALTRKGFIKMIMFFAVIFVGVVVFISVTES